MFGGDLVLMGGVVIWHGNVCHITQCDANAHKTHTRTQRSFAAQVDSQTDGDKDYTLLLCTVRAYIHTIHSTSYIHRNVEVGVVRNCVWSYGT
jgi:hypothetical protein